MTYVPEIKSDRIKDGTIQAVDLAPGVGGTNALPVGAAMDFEGFNLPTGWLWEAGEPVSRTTYSLLHDAITISQNGTLNGTINVTGLTSTRHLRVGCPVEGANIPAGATVASVVSTTAITLSAAATGSGTTALRFFPHGNARESASLTTTNTSNAITVTDGVLRGRLAVGMSVSGTGIQGGTTIATITATGITLSLPANASGTNVITFTDSTKFNLPDCRGVTTVGQDNMGTDGHAAGRLDSTFTGVSAFSGTQTHSLTPAQTALRSHNHAGTTSTESADHGHSGTTGNDNTDHGHSGTTGGRSAFHQHGPGTQTQHVSSTPTGGTLTFAGGGTRLIGTPTLTGNDNTEHTHAFSTGGRSAFHQHAITVGGVSANHTHTITVGNAAATDGNAAVNTNGAAHNNMQPSRVVNRIIYAGV